MKTNKLLVFGFGLMLSLGTLLFVNHGQAFAATKTWDSGGSDEKFSTAANWSGDSVPITGDSLVFPVDVMTSSCSASVTLVNDINPASVTFAGAAVTGSSSCGSSSYKSISVTGNEFTTSGDVSITDSSGAYFNFNVDITTTADVAITRATIGTSKTLAIGAHALTLDEVNVGGNITGSGTVTVTTGFSSFNGDNSTFTGAIIVGGNLSASNSNQLGTSAGGVTVNSGGSLTFNPAADMTIADSLTLNGGYLQFQYYNSGAFVTAEWTGPVTANQDSEVYLDDVNLKLSGTVTGSEHLKVVAGRTGSLTLPDGTILKSTLRTLTVDDSNKSTYCYDTDYGLIIGKNNKYVWNVNCPELGKKTGASGSFGSVYDGQIYGILAGTGAIGSVKIMSGGVIAPGLSPGTLTVSNLSFAEGGSYQFEMGGTAAGQFDQIIVNGAVNLGDGTLDASIYGTYKPAVGDSFVIISNDAADAVAGTFKNLGEGATFTVGGYVLRISYVGGDGNDVTLKVLSLPGAPDTGFGIITGNPLTVLGITSALAVGIYALSRKQKLLFKK
ncbi:MAG: hypothetical protein ABIQ89_00630 [Candidatus Saccharimonadales bacterium]